MRSLSADQFIFALSLLAALGSGLIAGTFFAFSTFVMRALARLPAHEGIAAMQAINVVVINPMFLGVFLGTAALCVAGAVGAALRRGTPGDTYLLSGAALYFIGTFGVTIVCNVPLNNALAKRTPDDPDAPRAWGDYVARWTFWNHGRTAAATAALACFILAMRQ
jgi:uncharacterized membrane protein